MSENFKKTVNLKDRMKASLENSRPVKKLENKAEQIDRLYEREKLKEDDDLKRMQRPKSRDKEIIPYRGIIFVLLITTLVFAYLAFSNKNDKPGVEMSFTEEWSEVKLSNGKIYYGLVGDKTADPLVVKNIYLNYDEEKGVENTAGGLRLIKQGKEVDLIRYQVESIKKLDENSPTLKAILDNEAK